MLPLYLTSISELFTFKLIMGLLLASLLNTVLMLLISYKYLQIIQQCGYKGGDYLKWLLRKDNVYFTRILMTSILSLLGFLLINMSLSFIKSNIVDYCGFLVYILFLTIYFVGEFKRKDRLPLVITKRLIRLVITFFIVTVLANLLLVISVNLVAIPFRENVLANFRYAIFCLCPILVPFLILLAYYINVPMEKAIIKKYINNCKQKLNSFDNLIKIGITGSYAKTSVKEILKIILSEKYKVLATPESYNTPLGISKTVKRLDGTEDVFIAEMGARQIGDIKELTEIVKPSIAVITGITSQHLETFRKIDNVIKTKYELIEHLEEGGKAFFSHDNDYTMEMFKKCPHEKHIAGIKNTLSNEVYADNIKYTDKGTSFTLHINGEKQSCITSLLGSHNVSNICLASSVACSLGLTLSEICSAIPKIKPIKHRMELVEGNNGVIIIDDSYNANAEGVKSAIKVLSEFEGKKYVVTPGIVELGIKENEINFMLGVGLSKVCDGVILVGRARALKIREGLLMSGFDDSKIFMVAGLEEAKAKIQEIAKEGDVVLFENDLPDRYL